MIARHKINAHVVLFDEAEVTALIDSARYRVRPAPTLRTTAPRTPAASRERGWTRANTDTDLAAK